MSVTDSPEVEILVGEGASLGSGRLVAPSLALTARHILFAADGTPYGTPRLRLLDDGRERPCLTVWDGGPELDLALVQLTAKTDYADIEHARWGAFIGMDSDFRCEAIGFPWAQEREGGWREVEQVRLRVALGTGLIEGLIQADIDTALPERREDGATWAGLSGAAVTVTSGTQSLVVGVVVAETERHDSRSLTVVPVYRALRDDGFRDAIEKAGGFVVFEPAELLSFLVSSAPRVPRSPTSLLRADAETVPFYGRTEELGRLRDWAKGSGLSVKMITGPGGQGKSRLARQFAAELAGEDWIVGLLGDIHRTADQVLPERLQGRRRKMLLVVDYAETKPELIARLLARMARPKEAVRVLLLSRSAEGWWQDLADSSFELGEMLATAEVYELTGSASAVEDVERFRTTMQTFATALTLLPDAWVPRKPSSAELETLLAVRFESPLAAQMAALAAVLGDPDGTAGGLGGESPEAVILSHEKRYWSGVAATRKLDFEVPVLRSAVAAATLCGAADVAAAIALAGRVPYLADQPQTVLLATSGWLRTLYPALGSGILGSLQPDVLGESLVAAVIREQPDWLPAILTGATMDQATQALTVLARVVDRDEQVRADLDRLFDTVPGLVTAAVRAASQIAEPDLLTSPVKRVLSQGVSFGEAWDVYQALPVVSHRLRAFSLEITVSLVRTAADIAEEEPAFLYPFFILVNDAGGRCEAVGEIELSLRFAEMAIELYETRLSDMADPPVAGYVASLSNLSRALVHCHRSAEAVRYAVCAAEISRSWLTADDAALVHAGVVAFSAAAAALKQNGRIPEAFAYSLAAVEPMRSLAEASDVVTTLIACRLFTNHAALLRSSGELESALRTATDAVVKLRSPGVQTIDTGHEQLSHALTIVAATLIDLGRSEEACAPLTEAIAILEGMSARDDLALAPLLADLFGYLLMASAELGRHDEALAAGMKQVDIFRSCHVSLPEVFGPMLSVALNNVAYCLKQLNRNEEARTTAEEAWTIIQPLFQAAPAEYLDHMARVEGQIAEILLCLGEPEPALAMARHVIDLVATYADDLVPWQERLAFMRSLVSLCAQGADDQEQAVSAAARSGLAHGPDDTGEVRADRLRHHICLLAESSVDAGNLELVTRVLTEYRALADAGFVGPDDKFTIIVLDVYSRTLAAAGRLADSVPPAEEAVRSAKSAHVAVADEVMVNLLQNLSNRYLETNRLAESLAVADKCLVICQSLYESNPDDFWAPLLMTLRHKGQLLAMLDDVPAAISVAVKAVPLAPENQRIPFALDVLIFQLIEQCPEDMPRDRANALDALLTLWRRSGQIPDVADLRKLWGYLYLQMLKVLLGQRAVPEPVVMPDIDAPLQLFAEAFRSVTDPLADVGEMDLARVAEREAKVLSGLIDQSSV